MQEAKKNFLSNELYDAFKGKKYHYALGRRKSSVAQVRLYPGGSGKCFINNFPFEQYLTMPRWQEKARSPLNLVNKVADYDVCIKVAGGGKRGQVDSICLGIARALVALHPEVRLTLKKMGFLTRDSRIKERKKFGLKRARRAPQWNKR